jgi:hypothetical protein
VKEMSDITLEKVDIIRERTGASYAEAKNSLEICNGDVVDALIYVEGGKENSKSDIYTTKDEFINWIKGVVRKGNVTRIKIKKEDKIILDIPVSAGIAVTGIAYIIATPLLALGILSAVVSKVTIEITKEDGSVEVVNKIIRNTVDEVKEKFDDITEDMNLKDKFDGFAGEVKDKFSNISGDIKNKVSSVTEEVKDKFNIKHKDDDLDVNNVYKYTVKFEEVKNENDEEKKEQSSEENLEDNPKS